MECSQRQCYFCIGVERILASTVCILFVLICVTSQTLANPIEPTVTATHIITNRDNVPRFCSVPTAIAINSGDWSNPSIWSSAQIPGAQARVLIPSGTEVTYDLFSDTEIYCIEVAEQGILNWSIDQSTRLRIINMQILPEGALVIGQETSPIANDSTAEIIFSDQPLDVMGVDPAQYGNGLHVFGAITLHGQPLPRTFLRFAQEASSGHNALQLEAVPSGWLNNDRLIIPDTRQIPFRPNHQYTSDAEEPIIAAVAGSTVTLTQPLTTDHHGPRDAQGNAGAIELSMLPHTGNLSRNIAIRSIDLTETGKDHYCLGEENLNATTQCVTRGHVMAHARAAVDVRYTSFLNLGRTTIDTLDNTVFDSQGVPIQIGTNQIGRYSMHIHHVAGPVNPGNTGFQYQFVGNVIEGFLKWGLTIHNSHYGLIKDNVLYDGNGSAIATEDGNESFNVFERNFIVHTKAGDVEQITLSPGRAGVANNRAIFGFTRDGFWFSGMYNYVRDNVVANAPGFAYNYNGYYLPGQQPIPNFRGADDSEFSMLTAPPVLESIRNEAYGATGQGLWLSWSRGCCNVSAYTDISQFSDYRIWHVNHSGVQAYHESRNTFERFILRNDPQVSEQSTGGSIRFNRGINLSNRSYENGQTIVRNVDIQGFNIGVQLPPRPEDGTSEPNVFKLENSLLHNYVNVQDNLPNMFGRKVRIRNVVFEPLDITPTPGLPAQPTNIDMRYFIDRQTSFIDKSSSTIVRDFNAVTGDDIEVYFTEQAPNYPIPPPPDFDHPNFHACPEANLTNQQCMEQFGIAIAGDVAPCVEFDGDPGCKAALARAAQYQIDGLVFPITAFYKDGFE